MGLQHGTICSKHDSILSRAEDIIDLVSKCLSDGQRMEDALNEYKGTIEDLEKELKEALREVEYYKDENEDLKKHIKELEREIEQSSATTA